MLYVLFTIPTIFQCMFFAFLEVYEEDIYGKGNSNIMTDITNTLHVGFTAKTVFLK